MDQKSKVSKKVNSVTTGKDGVEVDEWEWSKKFDDDYGEYWLCSAAKRARTEDDDDKTSNDAPTSPGPSGKGFGKPGGKSKGKGKGKGGPKGGCHECQGDHFVRDCEIRKQRKGNGKGKGDWGNPPPRQWNQWNPGFQKGQWGNWRPGGSSYNGFPSNGMEKEREVKVSLEI